MNVMELGALGEFVSSIAVVLTLAYLAFQTRLNSISTRSATNTAVAGQFVEMNMALASNTGLARAMLTDVTRLANAPVEDIGQMLAFWRGLFHLWSNAHRQHLNGTLDAAIYTGIVQEVSAYAEGSRDEVSQNEELARRGKPMRWAWEIERYLFNPEFQLFVDEHLGIER
jgi:hypothetical protein